MLVDWLSALDVFYLIFTGKLVSQLRIIFFQIVFKTLVVSQTRNNIRGTK